MNGVVIMDTESKITCKIEHHAILFALLAKHAITLCGDDGAETIQEGMISYGRERGARMAANAQANGDPLNMMTDQAYGEWQPEYEGQMEVGWVRTEPTFQTYIRKCPWCDAWKKHNIMNYGKLYCVNVDNAVYQGFRDDLVCKTMSTNLSFGGDQCVFDWGYPLSEEDAAELVRKKEALGTSCMKDFTYHTAHLLHTVGNTLKKELGEEGELAVKRALDEYVDKFGQEYLDVLEGVYE